MADLITANSVKIQHDCITLSFEQNISVEMVELQFSSFRSSSTMCLSIFVTLMKIR